VVVIREKYCVDEPNIYLKICGVKLQLDGSESDAERVALAGGKGTNLSSFPILTMSWLRLGFVFEGASPDFLTLMPSLEAK
jgi:hypothetical protein